VAFYTSLGINVAQVSRWTARYKAYLAYMEIFGEFDPDGADKFNQLADRAASGLMMLPTDYREAFFADIVNGDLPSQATVDEVNSRTEVKLSKAEELLAAARVRKEQADDKWEMVKSDQNIDTTSKEYKTASKAPQYFSKTINAYENKIADLTAQVEAEQARISEYERREEKTKSELEKLRFDDDSTREERIKRLTNSLTISVPQVMADLQKFFTEKDHYPTEVREHLLEQSVYLTNYIADQLDS
jgi:predicted RNase H-like nuclease (RuvC/YqgF family)